MFSIHTTPRYSLLFNVKADYAKKELKIEITFEDFDQCIRQKYVFSGAEYAAAVDKHLELDQILKEDEKQRAIAA